MFNFKLPWPKTPLIEKSDADYLKRVCDVHEGDLTKDVFAKIVKVLKRLRGEPDDIPNS